MKTKKEYVRMAGKLGEMITVSDEKGNVLDKIFSPLMIEFHPRDVMQVIVGASILAIPVSFTEEVWSLGVNLPLRNVVGILLLSIFFISSFIYYNYYRGNLQGNTVQFFKRAISTYLFSFLTVAILLTLIERAPWGVDWILAVKRIILVSFPASMSAAVADMIK
jgi:uncharacterized membrane protein